MLVRDQFKSDKIFLKKTVHVENFGPIVLSEQQVIRDT